MTFVSALAWILLLIGTYLLSHQRFIWDGLLFVALSLGLLASYLFKRRDQGMHLWSHVQTLFPRGWGGWVRMGGVALSALVAINARSRPAHLGFSAALIAWVMAVAGFALSLLLQLPRNTVRSRSERREIFPLVGLLVAAALLRGVAVGRIPTNLGGDEGTQLVAGLELLTPPLGNPFATGWYSVPTMSFLAYGLGMEVFGASVAGARALSVVIGTLTVATTYLLGKVLSGHRIGLLSAAFVAFSAYHIHFSRLASNQIADPLIGTLTLWLIWRSLNLQPSVGRAEALSSTVRGQSRYYSAWYGRRGGEWQPHRSTLLLGLAGIVAGCGWYAYFGARWVTVLAALIFGWRALCVPDFLRRYWRGLLLFGLGLGVVTLPLAGWYAIHPSPLTERVNAVSIFASGWLAREIELTGKGPVALLLQQFWRSATAFHLTSDRTFWYFSERPLLDFLTGALMLVGFIEAVVKAKWPSRGLALLWFLPTLLVAWTFTESPPSSQRGLLMLPVAAIFAAWGGDLLAHQLHLRRSRLRWGALLLVTCVALLNGWYYFAVYTPRRIYGNPTAEMATAFARYALDHPEPVCSQGGMARGDCAGRVYLLGPPLLHWDFGAFRFMVRGMPGYDVPEETVPLDVQVPARFAFIPERSYQLEIVKVLYPGGRTEEIVSPDGRLLMVIYDWLGPGR